MKHTNMQHFEVLGYRNHITCIRIPSTNKVGYTRTAPVSTPHKQLEAFDSRFTTFPHSLATMSDSFETLKREFHA